MKPEVRTSALLKAALGINLFQEMPHHLPREMKWDRSVCAEYKRCDLVGLLGNEPAGRQGNFVGGLGEVFELAEHLHLLADLHCRHDLFDD